MVAGWPELCTTTEGREGAAYTGRGAQRLCACQEGLSLAWPEFPGNNSSNGGALYTFKKRCSFSEIR